MKFALRRRQLRAALLSALLSGILWISGCSGKSASNSQPVEVVRDVALVNLQPSSVPDQVESVGTVRAAETVQLAAQIMGNIVAIHVREGDRVARGQVLAAIDDAQPRAGLERAQALLSAAEHDTAAAEAQYSLASVTLKRYEDLFNKQSVSPQEFDEIKARYQGASARREMARASQAQAKAALAQAQTMLQYTRIRAPFDGVVTEKRVDPGALAVPGMPLLVVEKTGRFRLEATVDESNLRYVKMGQRAAVQVDALGGEPLQGRVVEIVPAADPGSRTFVVKIELPANPQLRSGLFGRAFFERGQRESLLVPRTAVVDRGQLQGVYVVGQNTVADLRYVTLGKNYGDRVEVLSGLQPGERLVASPGPRDLSGKRVE